MNYNGPSMQPTLQPGDRLNIVPCSDADLRVGDVVVFNKTGEAEKVVHRVVETCVSGLRTWGDNNSYMDSEIIESGNVVGRVVSIKRSNETIIVKGGLKGRALGFFRRTRKRIDAAVSKRLHSIYYSLSKSGIFIRLFSIRLISFNRDSGVETQLVWRGKVIGRCLPGERKWRIKRPYRLFVDIKSLPKNNHA